MLPLALLLLALLAFACKRQRHAPRSGGDGSPPAEVAATDAAPAPDRILFLNYIFRKGEQEVPEVRLLDQRVVAGKLKAGHAGQSGAVACVQLDGQDLRLDSAAAGNPLYQTVEYVNDTGGLAMAEIQPDSAYLSLRMQLHPQARTILLLLRQDGGQADKVLITHPID